MASLESGVLVKLLEDMGMDERSVDSQEPALLQIRSIVPLLEEGNLWPNQGFCLKVSDQSHAAYVYLPEEQNEMILNNHLQLGQLIYVQKLEASYPAPVLRGFRPVPGRQPCLGSPVDIVNTENMVKFWGSSPLDSVPENNVYVDKKARGRPRSVSPITRAHSKGHCPRRTTSKASSKKCNVEKTASLSSFERDSDSDCSKSSFSSTVTVTRRSSIGTEAAKVKEVSGSPNSKGLLNSISRTRSAPVSTVSLSRSSKHESSDDSTGSLMRRKYIGHGARLGRTHSKIKVPLSKDRNLEAAETGSSGSDRKTTETKIRWNSLPSPMVKLGKEMVRHRDAALQAAVEALQEASASERLIKCLSIFSQLQPSKEGDFESLIGNFLDFQGELDKTRLVMQSLTNINVPRSSDAADSNSTVSVKEVLNLAFDRKKNATTWIKEAIASNLSPCPGPVVSTSGSQPEELRINRSSASTRGIKPKCVSIVRKHKRSTSNGIVEEADREGLPDRVKEVSLSTASELTSSMQNECRRRVLENVEKYLDRVESKTDHMESDGKIAELLCQIKKINDWLDVIAAKANQCSDSLELEESEADTCRRVKNKIYGILLKHVERTAIALETVDATGER